MTRNPIDRRSTLRRYPRPRAGSKPRSTGLVGVGVALSAPTLAFLAHLAVVFGTAVLTVALTPDRAWTRPDVAGVGRYLVAPLAIWDGGWYAEIAAAGYGGRPEAAAFWPLFPLVLRAGGALTGWGPLTVGVLVSNAAFLPALVALHRLVRLDHGAAAAARAVWLLALCPTAFYFSAAYTESLFLLVSVGAVLCARTGRWWPAGALAALAAATRNTGVLVLLPLAALLVEEHGGNPRRWWRCALPLALVPLGPLLFAWHLDRLWGDPLLPLHARGYWDRHGAWPWQTLAAGIGHYPRVLAGDVPSGDGIASTVGLPALLPALALLPACFRRLGAGHGLYAAAAIGAPLANPAAYDPLLSVPRYLVVVYPLVVALALCVRSPARLAVVLLAGTVALVSLLALFAQGYFVA